MYWYIGPIERLKGKKQNSQAKQSSLELEKGEKSATNKPTRLQIGKAPLHFLKKQKQKQLSALHYSHGHINRHTCWGAVWLDGFAFVL